MTDRKPPRPPQQPRQPAAPPRLEEFRPVSERSGSPLQQLRPPPGQSQRQRPPVGQRRPPPRLGEPQSEGRSWFLTLLLWGGFGVAGLIGAAVLALMVWSPGNLVRDQLIARVKAKTGRDLVVSGATSLSFYPSLAISMGDVSLSPPPGMPGAPTATMQLLEASVPLLPLLQSKVNVERLVLRKPVVNLRVDTDGRRSWDFAQYEQSAPIRLAQAGGTRPGQMPKELQDFVKSANPDSREAVVSRGPLAALESLSLEDVRIEDGTIRYADARSGRGEEIGNVDARLSLASIASPLHAKGSLVWRGTPLTFDARLTSPKLLSDDRPARLLLTVNGQPAGVTYDGTVSTGRSPEAEGTLAFKAQSISALAALIGAHVPEGSGIDSASLDGRLSASETAVTVSGMTLSLGALSAQGTIAIEPRPVRPMIRGNLQIAELDLNALSLPKIGASKALDQPRASPSQRIVPAGKPAQSIEDLLRDNPGTAKGSPARVQGYLQRTGWSDDAIDLSAFQLFDADLKLAIGRLLYRDMKIGQTQIRLGLKERVLTANFDEMQLYDGRARGLLTIDGTAAVPSLGANLAMEGVSAAPLLKDAANYQWLAGRARINYAIAGQGATERQIVASLHGKADINVKDGAVVGFNVQKILNGLMQGRFAGLERSPAEKTDFSEMSASFAILNGIAQNRDLKLFSPIVRITGAGAANLADRTLDYTLRPKLVTAAQGQTNPVDPTGLEIPVKLTGSWDRPTISPDIDGVLKNPDQAVDAIKQFGKQFQEKNPEAMNKAKELLNQFLKR